MNIQISLLHIHPSSASVSFSAALSLLLVDFGFSWPMLFLSLPQLASTCRASPVQELGRWRLVPHYVCPGMDVPNARRAAGQGGKLLSNHIPIYLFRILYGNTGVETKHGNNPVCWPKNSSERWSNTAPSHAEQVPTKVLILFVSVTGETKTQL